jgi:hypothetical protein
VTYTAHDPRLFYDAILARLIAQSIARGLGSGAGLTAPYAVVFPLDEDGDPTEVGTLADAHESTWFAFRVFSVGTSTLPGGGASQALWMQQKVRSALLGWKPTVAGISLGRIERDGGFGLRRDDDVQPPIFDIADDFRVFAS